MSQTDKLKVGDEKQIWAIVPAAGIGQRMQSSIPKQYLLLNGQTILQLTLERLLSVEKVQGVVVALQPDDDYWSQVSITSKKPVLRADGGAERCFSVINAMRLLQQQESYNQQDAWVMVHDAVRSCVSIADIENLITVATQNESGGLLATPVRDTMKRQGKDQHVDMTVDREGLWHALTPQLFPFQSLYNALMQSQDQGFMVTDESSAMEYAGFSPALVHGSDKNIKITRPDDLELAEHLLNVEARK